MLWMNLTSNYHWQVGFVACKVGTTNITLNVSTDVILDSGTSLTYIPTAEYNQVISLITAGKTCTTSNGYLYCPCKSTSDSSFPTITLYFKGVFTGSVKSFSFSPYYYLGTAATSGQCYLSIIAETTSGTTYWLVGDNFLLAYYQVYDMTNLRIGMASSSYITASQYSISSLYTIFEQNMTDGTNMTIYSNETVSPIDIVANPEDTTYFGLSSQNFTVVVIVVCGGGALLIFGISICVCCYVRKKNMMRKKQSEHRPAVKRHNV